MKYEDFDFNKHALILYDGECGFCNASVNFIMDHDPKHNFRFAAQQSEPGQYWSKQVGVNLEQVNSLLLIESPQRYRLRGPAVLKIASGLSGFYGFMGTCVSWLPGWLVNPFYRLVARYRRSIPAKEACRMPTPEIRERFLEM